MQCTYVGRLDGEENGGNTIHENYNLTARQRLRLINS